MAVNDSCKTKQTKKKPNQPKRIVDEMIGKKLWGTLKYRLIGWESINKVMCCCSSTVDCEARLLLSFTSGAATTSVAASEECGRASSPLPRLVTVALSVQCPFFYWNSLVTSVLLRNGILVFGSCRFYRHRWPDDLRAQWTVEVFVYDQNRLRPGQNNFIKRHRRMGQLVLFFYL